MHIFLVHRPPLDVRVVRIAERLPVVAHDDDDRVLVELEAANGVEEPSEMAIGLVQHVQIPFELVLIGHRFALKAQKRDVRRWFVRMMRLRRPSHHEEGPVGRLRDEVDHPVHHAAVFDAPGRNQRARELVEIAELAEAAALEKRSPSCPGQIAGRDKRRAIPAIAEHRRDRCPGQIGVFLGDVAEAEFRIRRQKYRRK